MKKLTFLSLLILGSNLALADQSQPKTTKLEISKGQCQILEAQITKGGALVVDYSIGARPASTLIMRSDRGVLTSSNTLKYDVELMNGTEFSVEVRGDVDTAVAGKLYIEDIVKIQKHVGLNTVICQ